MVSDPSLITLYYKLGLRMLGIAHFVNNDFGDSSTDPAGVEWHGLSPKGRELVVAANRLRIVLDTSRASDDVLDQLLELSTVPIVLSHSDAEPSTIIRGIWTSEPAAPIGSGRSPNTWTSEPIGMVAASPEWRMFPRFPR